MIPFKGRGLPSNREFIRCLFVTLYVPCFLMLDDDVKSFDVYRAATHDWVSVSLLDVFRTLHAVTKMVGGLLLYH